MAGIVAGTAYFPGIKAMRVSHALTAILLVTSLLPNVVVSGKIGLHQDTDEISFENRLFVKRLYTRLGNVLSSERKKYDAPYTQIKLAEVGIKERIVQTTKERKDAEEQLKAINVTENEIKKLMSKATSAAEKVEISKRLEQVEKERINFESRVNALKAEESGLKDSLQMHLGMHFDEERSLKRELDRISKQQTELFYKYADWELRGTEKHYLALRNYLVRAAEKAAVICNVNISSERNSVQTTGAIIKYQTPEQRQIGKSMTPAKTAKCLTACFEEMKPNTYYIWTERDNKPTSDPDLIFTITNEQERVRLQEFPNQ